MPTHEDFMKENILIVNRIINNNKYNHRFTLIDLNPLFKKTDGYIIESLSYDGLHLNEKGYEHWVNILKPIINNL
jgi:lysophospholipase L1-like esterase